MADQERTCRYGHGPLEEIEGLWGIQGFRKPEPGETDEQGLWKTRTVFTIAMLKCPLCGYIELQDKD